MIEVINSRNVPDVFKNHFVNFFLFSYFIVLVCIVPYFCNQELCIQPVAMISFFLNDASIFIKASFLYSLHCILVNIKGPITIRRALLLSFLVNFSIFAFFNFSFMK